MGSVWSDILRKGHTQKESNFQAHLSPCSAFGRLLSLYTFGWFHSKMGLVQINNFPRICELTSGYKELQNNDVLSMLSQIMKLHLCKNAIVGINESEHCIFSVICFWNKIFIMGLSRRQQSAILSPVDRPQFQKIIFTMVSEWAP